MKVEIANEKIVQLVKLQRMFDSLEYEEFPFWDELEKLKKEILAQCTPLLDVLIYDTKMLSISCYNSKVVKRKYSYVGFTPTSYSLDLAEGNIKIRLEDRNLDVVSEKIDKEEVPNSFDFYDFCKIAYQFERRPKPKYQEWLPKNVESLRVLHAEKYASVIKMRKEHAKKKPRVKKEV